MMLLMEAVLAYEATKKSVRIAVIYLGREHVFTLAIPVVKKTIKRRELVFKVEPIAPGQLRLLIQERRRVIPGGGYGNCEWEF